MYSVKQLNLFIVIYSFILPIVIFAGATLLPTEYAALPIYIGSVAHVLPYYLSLRYYKREDTVKASALIISNLIRVLISSLTGCVFSEILLIFIYGRSQYNGLITIILFFIFLIIWLIFAIALAAIKRRKEKKF